MLETKSTLTQKPAGSTSSRVIQTVVAVVLLAIIGVLVFRGINSRIKAASNVKQETLELAVPAVSVIHPKLGALKDELVLPGNIQAFTDSPIYARASGYLKAWHADIGAHVKAGQLLAEIEAPEVDQQVAQAKASLQQAKDALDQAQANYQQERRTRISLVSRLKGGRT